MKVFAASIFCFTAIVAIAGNGEDVDFDIRLDSISSGFDKKSCWVHPRAGAIPGKTPIVVLTMQKAAIVGSDIFGPLQEMRTDDLGATWTPPLEHAETLGRRDEPDGVVVVPSDFWPKWHSQSQKLLGIGHNVRYQNNKVVPFRRRETVYSVYDPINRRWTSWDTLPMPDQDRFYGAGAGCVQRLDLPNGDILLPIYYTPKGEKFSAVVVIKCSFDGQRLAVKELGNDMRLDTDRGLGEPSLTRFGNRYFLTMRHDKGAYVSTSEDGLNFLPPKPWLWDDGSDLGSYNTQAHWVTHDDGLFLVYTRRNADNDHIPRHRAPLFIGRVDTESLRVIRRTERMLMPQRGAKLGNFGVTEVNENETWVTDAEWMQTNGPNYSDYTQCMKYGSDNAVFAARIQWKKPNTTWNQR